MKMNHITLFPGKNNHIKEFPSFDAILHRFILSVVIPFIIIAMGVVIVYASEFGKPKMISKNEGLPTLTPYLLQGEKLRPAIIVCPGGAFQFEPLMKVNPSQYGFPNPCN